MTIDGVDIYIERIEPAAASGRRLSERRAVNTLVSRVFGQDRVLEHRDDGSPYITGFDGCVSVSHCRDCAVLAVDRAGRAIGIDIEQWRDQLNRVADRFLSPNETKWKANEATLLSAWTIKESVYKALRPTEMSMLEVVLPAAPCETGTASGCRFTTADYDEYTITVAVKYL